MTVPDPNASLSRNAEIMVDKTGMAKFRTALALERTTLATARRATATFATKAGIAAVARKSASATSLNIN
jgi:hypothetical protein